MLFFCMLQKCHIYHNGDTVLGAVRVPPYLQWRSVEICTHLSLTDICCQHWLWLCSDGIWWDPGWLVISNKIRILLVGSTLWTLGMEEGRAASAVNALFIHPRQPGSQHTMAPCAETLAVEDVFIVWSGSTSCAKWTAALPGLLGVQVHTQEQRSSDWEKSGGEVSNAAEWWR